MQAYFEIEDVSWIASEARKLWAGDPAREENRLHHLLIQNPQPHLMMPANVDLTLNPFSADYRNEILKLWQAIFDRGSNRSESVYNIAEHEQDAAYDACPIRFPGYMSQRDPGAVRHAAYEVAMLADVMLHSNLSAGKRALEYGAGSGNIAINLARLGVKVDTVDISATYCDHIRQNAEFYGVELKSHNEEFGFDPSGGAFKYDAIIFHACFHHSIDHADLISRMHDILADDGVLILSNEPIYDDFYCPWGLRTDPECISVVAGRGWMELGFRTSYLRELFFRKGFILSPIKDNFSRIALYAARKVPRSCEMNLASPYSALITGGFPPEPAGKWTDAEVHIPISAAIDSAAISVEVANLFPIGKAVEVQLGGEKRIAEVPAGEGRVVTIPRPAASVGGEIPHLVIKTQTSRPVDHMPGTADDRPLGVMLRSISYTS